MKRTKTVSVYFNQDELDSVSTEATKDHRAAAVFIRLAVLEKIKYKEPKE